MFPQLGALGIATLALPLIFIGTSCAGPESDGAGAAGQPIPPTGTGDDSRDCEPSAARGFALDGDDDYITMGEAPELGLATFTLEAWVRREGRGQITGTGVGGLQMVPLITKGRGERDGSNVDCNYAFGIVGEVLGADFEDAESGKNHPVVGNTPLLPGRWHHVAATYDGSRWRLYLDGELDAEREVGATPRSDSIQHFAVGAALNSEGEPVGGFAGAVDEVRVWNRARTADEIRGGMLATPDGGDGLISRWTFDDGTDDSVGVSHGEATGGDFEAGVVLDRGAGPEIVAMDHSSTLESELVLDVRAMSPAGLPVRTSYYLRRIDDADDFTIAVLPDSQGYTPSSVGREHLFLSQTQWISEHIEAENIVGAIHNGDIVDDAGVPYQWSVADEALSMLEVASDTFPDGLPLGLAVGNHDQEPRGETGATEAFNEHFGPSRFADRGYYGGRMGGTNNSWVRFSAGSLDIVVVNLEYDSTLDPATFDWARQIFQTHPSALGIVNSHHVLTRGGAFSDQGAALYQALRDLPNVRLMTSGHVTAESLRTEEYQGNTIHAMVANYEALDGGGNGWMRIWRFSPERGELAVRTFSPALGEYQDDVNSKFEIPVNLIGAGREFERVADRWGERTQFVADVEPGTYEWYAEVDDCEMRGRSEIRRVRVE